jgi:thiol-disulfide isomerase/thioredoxin
MLKTRFEWAILLVIAGLLGVAWIIESRVPVAPSPSGLLTEAPIAGHVAPDFESATVAGDVYRLSDLVRGDSAAGMPVVLNFWASWCAPCRLEMPYFERVSLAYAGRAAVLGINQGESPETIARFAQTTGVTYPLLVDEQWTVNNRYGVYNLPTTVFIDAEGVVREVSIGTMSQAVLEDKLNRLLES